MHISEGVLSGEVLAAGAVVAVAGAAWGLKKIQNDDLPKVAIMSATFFIASLIHVPLGPASLHLVLGGLVGLLLGWASFPALLVALALQALLFSFGGLVVLGVNTVVMALPALACYYLFSPLVRSNSNAMCLTGAALAGAGYVLVAGSLSALVLYLSGEAFITAAQAILLAHLPLAALEGLITALAVGFIRRVRPAMLFTIGSLS